MPKNADEAGLHHVTLHLLIIPGLKTTKTYDSYCASYKLFRFYSKKATLNQRATKHHMALQDDSPDT